MGSETANLKIVEDVYSTWSKQGEGSFQAFMNLLADDVQWHSAGRGDRGMEFTRRRSSKQDVFAYFLGLQQDWEMQHYTPEHFVAQGDWVVMRGTCSWRHRRTNKVCNTPKADFFRLRNGKVVEFHEFFDTAAAFAAAQ